MLYVFLLITGIVSGTLGGMGMGGGTLLIPLLTLFFGINQKVAQGLNLISFSIMAIFVLIIHAKNKLVDIKTAVMFLGFASITSILGALLATIVKARYLKFCYGALLIAIAIYQVVGELKKIKKSN